MTTSRKLQAEARLGKPVPDGVGSLNPTQTDTRSRISFMR